MSEKLRSSTEKKYKRSTRVAAGLLTSAGLFGTVTACSDNTEAQSTPNVAASANVEVNNPQDITQFTEGTTFTNYNELVEWVNNPDGVKMYSDFGSNTNADIEHQANLVELGYLPDNQTGLTSIYINGGIDSIITSIKDEQITLESLHALESLLEADIKYLKFQKLYDQNLIDYVIKGLEADLITVRIILSNADIIYAASSVNCVNTTAAGTWKYPTGCNVPSTTNPDITPDPAGAIQYFKQPGIKTNYYDVTIMLEQTADNNQVAFASKTDSEFPQPR